MPFLLTAFSGWAVALLLGAGISLPYLARYLRWSSLTAHYGLGMLMPLAATLHASLPMASVPMGRFNATGLLLATGALALMVWQAGLGLALRSAQGSERRRMKRMHIGTMTLMVALVTSHIALS